MNALHWTFNKRRGGWTWASSWRGRIPLTSETRLRVLEQLRPEMLRMVDGDMLPGELALAYYDGEFLLFVSADAAIRGPLSAVAHDAVHMLRGLGSCNIGCEAATRNLEEWLSDVLRLSQLG
jgi:hypothetical protein